MHQAGSADVILSQEPLGERVLRPWAMLHTYTPHTLKRRRDQGRLLNSFLRTKAFMGPVVLRTAGFDKWLASAQRSVQCESVDTTKSGPDTPNKLRGSRLPSSSARAQQPWLSTYAYVDRQQPQRNRAPTGLRGKSELSAICTF